MPESALGPAQAQLHRAAGARFLGRVLRTLVERHHDVAAQLRLRVDDRFRRKKVLRAVKVRPEFDPLLANFSQGGKTEELIAAGIGENRPRPADKRVQPAEFGDRLAAGTQVEVVSVAEDNRRVEFFLKVLGGQPLDRSLRAHGHERGGLDRTVRGAQQPGSRARDGAFRHDFEMGVHDETLPSERRSMPLISSRTSGETQ